VQGAFADGVVHRGEGATIAEGGVQRRAVEIQVDKVGLGEGGVVRHSEEFSVRTKEPPAQRERFPAYGDYACDAAGLSVVGDGEIRDQ
jgi:hypothetical protein